MSSGEITLLGFSHRCVSTIKASKSLSVFCSCICSAETQDLYFAAPLQAMNNETSFSSGGNLSRTFLLVELGFFKIFFLKGLTV